MMKKCSNTTFHGARHPGCLSIFFSFTFCLGSLAERLIYPNRAKILIEVFDKQTWWPRSRFLLVARNNLISRITSKGLKNGKFIFDQKWASLISHSRFFSNFPLLGDANAFILISDVERYLVEFQNWRQSSVSLFVDHSWAFLIFPAHSQVLVNHFTWFGAQAKAHRVYSSTSLPCFLFVILKILFFRCSFE